MARTKPPPRKSIGSRTGQQQQHPSQQARATIANTQSPGVRKAPVDRGQWGLEEIRTMQKSTKQQIPKAALRRVVYEATQTLASPENNFRWKASALDVLQEAAEQYLTELIHCSNLAAIHCDRVTIKPKDTRLVRRVWEYIEYNNIDKCGMQA